MSCILFPPCIFSVDPLYLQNARLCKCPNAPLSLLHFFFTSFPPTFFCFPTPQTNKNSLSHLQVSQLDLYLNSSLFFWSVTLLCPCLSSSPDATTAKETSKTQAVCGVVPCPRSQSFVDGPSLHETAAAHYHNWLHLSPPCLCSTIWSFTIVAMFVCRPITAYFPAHFSCIKYISCFFFVLELVVITAQINIKKLRHRH